MPLSPRQRMKLERFRQKMKGLFAGGEPEKPRPKLCPSCGTLVGAGATRCHQCGASMTFSVAAASRSLGSVLPTTSPATYGILGFSCLLYIVSFLWTLRLSGLSQPSGGAFGILNSLGGIDGQVLQRFGASLPLAYNLQQPWRFVMAVFLHGSLLHIGFNMWVLMDVGPQIEELYGSARSFSFTSLRASVGIAQQLLQPFQRGRIGGNPWSDRRAACHHDGPPQRRDEDASPAHHPLADLHTGVGLVIPGNRQLRALGWFDHGFILGRIMMDRPPLSPEERKRAYLLGWSAALIVALSFAMTVYANLHVPPNGS